MSGDRSGTVELADATSDLLNSIVGALLIGIGLLAAWSAVEGFATGLATPTLLSTAGLLVFSFVLVASGVFLTPWLRRRLDRRHSVTRFGRVRSVDEGVIHPEDDCGERCVTCGAGVDKGLIRRYRDEYAVAGVPVSTASEGHNHYCVDCATDEMSGPGSEDGEAKRECSGSGSAREPAFER